jgi:spermidine synthase
VRLNARDQFALATGASLLGGQIVAVREIGSTFFATELTAAAATLATVAGLSVGYGLSRRVDERSRRLWGAASLAFLALSPVAIRALVGLLGGYRLETAAALVMLLGVPGLVSGWLATVLPRLADKPEKLPRFYALESAGALAMLLIFALSPGWRWTLGVFWFLLAFTVYRAFERRGPALAASVAAAALCAFYPALDRFAARLYYAGFHGLPDARVLESRYSPFQRIDVVESAEGKSLFLDGVAFFRSGDLAAFNGVIAAVPGSLVPEHRRGDALVVGSGSFSSSAILTRLGYKVTVVELDAAVARVGLEHFSEFHGFDGGEIDLVIDDARRALRRYPRRRFDLIALDIPAPFHLRTAMLYTPSFYRLVASRLKEDGLAALSLCSYGWAGRVGGSIAASAARAFGEVHLVSSDSVGLSFLYASPERLPFLPEAVPEAFTRFDLGRVETGSDAFVRERLESLERRPLSRRRLAAALTLARWQLPRMFDEP